MAKQQTPKRDPFSNLIPNRFARPEAESDAQAESEPQTPLREVPPVRKQKKVKLTGDVPKELAERAKNAAYHNRKYTVSSIIERGVRLVMDEIERENNGPYPERDEELKGGRPYSRP